jgi:hypothetical protein
MVAEHRAGWLYTSRRHDEALEAYEWLARQRSLGEADRHRLAHDVTTLRAQLGR